MANLHNQPGSTWNKKRFDLVVVGGGHAGIEAALAGVRMGLNTALVSSRLDTIGQMSCNPAIGGLGKGHLVREIDALGGAMARATDSTGIQFRMLNKGKGPAVWSPRAQIDKQAYAVWMQHLLREQAGLRLIEGTVVDVRVEKKLIQELILDDGRSLSCGVLLLCSGTFLNGVTHTGCVQQQAGRVGEPAVRGLTEALAAQGVRFLRYKTGTPPRVYRDSVDLEEMEQQNGDSEYFQFHHYSRYPRLADHPCWISYTNDQTHNLLRDNLYQAPLFSGQINSTGPRYCPSVEDKIVRFADKERHQLFLEPESLDSDELYVNGFSTSMPAEVQLAALRTVPGYHRVRFSRPGYAIEYDYVPCGQIAHNLQHRELKNLFLAGQINGTSGTKRLLHRV